MDKLYICRKIKRGMFLLVCFCALCYIYTFPYCFYYVYELFFHSTYQAGRNLLDDLKEKLDPYLQPLYDALRDMLSQQKLESLIQQGVIEIAPLAFMRGRTLDNAFVILDEAQNTSMEQLKMFLTRMGRNSKFIITGDVTQIDLPKNQISGLLPTIERVQHIKGIAVIELQACDIVRHRLVSKIIEALD